MKRLTALLIAGVLLLSGCAFFQNVDTPEKKYLVAREQLNKALEEYINIQDEVSYSTHEEIKTAFIAADSALDAWGRHLDNGLPYDQDMALWMDAKTIIIRVLREIN